MVQKLNQSIDPPPKTPQILCVLLFALTLHFLFFLGRSSVFMHTAQGMKAVDVSQDVLKKYSLKTLNIFLKQQTLHRSSCSPLDLFSASFSGAVGIFGISF